MAKLLWNQAGEKKYETGISNGVLYPIATDGSYPAGHAWNGLISITESPEGAELTSLYADNTKYIDLQSVEEFKGSIEAYAYPKEFGECDGTKEALAGVKLGQQARKAFGMSYITKIGNDVDGDAHGELIHVVYGCKASPSEKSYSTINDSPDAATFSWDFSSTPAAVTGHAATSTITIDTTQLAETEVNAVKDALFGTDVAEAYLPDPDTLIGLATA